MKNAFLDSELNCKEYDCLDKLEVLYELKVFNKKPKKCPYCQSKDLEGLEIIGAKEGVLFWECNECLYKFLKYTKDKTLQYLQEAKDSWYNPKDWENNIERN